MTKEVAKKLVFTKEQQAFIAGLKDTDDSKDLTEFNSLSNEEKIEMLELQLGIDSDALDLEGKIVLEQVGFKTDGINILVFGSKGIRGVSAGRRITAMFVGMSYIFSDKEIENWAEVMTADGSEKKWRTEYARFRKVNGVEFGIFTCPMLRNALRTLLTNTATPNLVANDPVVTIEYHGLVSKEIAKKDFNFEMNTGNKTHAVIVKKEKGALENLNAGIHNYLVSPIPSSKVDLDDLTRSEREALSFDNQVKLNEETGVRQGQVAISNENAQAALQ